MKGEPGLFCRMQTDRQLVALSHVHVCLMLVYRGRRKGHEL